MVRSAYITKDKVMWLYKAEFSSSSRCLQVTSLTFTKFHELKCFKNKCLPGKSVSHTQLRTRSH